MICTVCVPEPNRMVWLRSSGSLRNNCSTWTSSVARCKNGTTSAVKWSTWLSTNSSTTPSSKSADQRSQRGRPYCLFLLTHTLQLTQGRPFYCSIGGKMVSTFVINLKLNWIVWFVPIRQSTIWPIREPIKKVLRERPPSTSRSNWSPCKLRVVCTITGQEELGKDGKGYELYFIKLISVATANWEDLATQALGASHL